MNSDTIIARYRAPVGRYLMLLKVKNVAIGRGVASIKSKYGHEHLICYYTMTSRCTNCLIHFDGARYGLLEV